MQTWIEFTSDRPDVLDVIERVITGTIVLLQVSCSSEPISQDLYRIRVRGSKDSPAAARVCSEVEKAGCQIVSVEEE